MRPRPVFICFADTERRRDPNPSCPNAAEHVPSPVDYGGFFEWCEQMAKTHVQRRCPSCGLFALWVERVPCSVCGRRYAPISDGSPRSHRSRDGRGRCEGAHRPPKAAADDSGPARAIHEREVK